MTLPEPVLKALRDLSLTARPATDKPWAAIVVVPGATAFDAWTKLAAASRGRGCWPVIMGTEAAAAGWPTDDGGTSVAETIAAANAVDLGAFMLRDADDVDEENDGTDVETGDWPAAGEVGTQSTPAAIADHDGKPYARVAIALFAVGEPWEALARLGFGHFNDCPSPAGHVARHRDWQGRLGAEVCAVTSDTVECHVARPPKTREAALALAREQYFYCYDIVEQGTGTLAVLAAGLLDAPFWFFWWD